MDKRTLGRTGIELYPVGNGTWAMGGRMDAGDLSLGWGEVDDAESTRAIRRAVELGVTLFDTADVYGVGHAEQVLGAALRPVRDRAQGALAWIWARSERTIPLPGCRTVAQVEENVGALDRGPLTKEQMAEIAGITAGTTRR